MFQPSHTELFTIVKPGLYGLDHGLDYIWTDSMLYLILQKIATLIMIIPTFRPATTGWISVNMNDHHINIQPRNTESSAPLVLMLVSPTV